MYQKRALNAALPACGVARSLASFGASAKAEINGKRVENPSNIKVAREESREASGRTFFQFTDIDFRKLMRVIPSTPAESKLKSINHSDPKNVPHDSGLGLLAAAPLIGAGRGSGHRQRGFLSRLISGGGTDPEPEKSQDKTDPETSKRGGIRQTISTLWKIWERPTQLLPSPWSSVVKWGVPAVAVTCGMVWFQTVLQVGILGAQAFGGLLEPMAGAAAFIVPMATAGSIFRGIEKLFRLEPTTGWKYQAIVRTSQAALLTGAAIWVHSIGLAPITYGIWSAAALATGYLAGKVFKSSKAKIWASVATAIVLPGAPLLTQRTFDVTVLGAGPDPEVGAWNVTTDLSKLDHWKSVAFFGKQAPPSGKSGMVLLNRDVPLYLPPHREANEFNGHFGNLVGKQVRVTTIGAWLKPISSKLQPTIVKYKVRDTATTAPAAKEAGQK